MTLHRQNGQAVHGGRVLGRSHRNAGGHEVHQMPGLASQLCPGFDANRPVNDERRADATFMAVVFIQPPGRIAGVGPGTAVAHEGVGLAHVLEGFSLMQNVRSGLRAQVNANPGFGNRRIGRCEVKAKGVPLGAGPVVAEEEDESVVQFMGLAQVLDDPAHICIQAVHHGGIGGHAMGEVGAALGGQ